MTQHDGIRYAPGESTPIHLGPKLKADLKRELRRLLAEWRVSISLSRRTELEKKIASISDLLQEDRQ